MTAICMHAIIRVISTHIGRRITTRGKGTSLNRNVVTGCALCTYCMGSAPGLMVPRVLPIHHTRYSSVLHTVLVALHD